MFVQQIETRKNSYKNFWLASLAFYFITESVKDSDLTSKIKVIKATSFQHIPHNSILYGK